MKKNNKLPKIEIVAETRPDDIENNVLYLTPEKKAAFYEEIFSFYMETIKDENPERWIDIQNIVNLLAPKPHYVMVYICLKELLQRFTTLNLLRFYEMRLRVMW